MHRVAIDLHGTYDVCPEMFEKYLFGLKGVEFLLMTGSPEADVRPFLEERAKLTSSPEAAKVLSTMPILSIVDYCFSQKLPMEKRLSPRTNRETWYFAGDEEIWWAMKAIMCYKHHVDLLIDDKVEYYRFFGNWSPEKPQFIRFYAELDTSDEQMNQLANTVAALKWLTVGGLF